MESFASGDHTGRDQDPNSDRCDSGLKSTDAAESEYIPKPVSEHADYEGEPSARESNA